MFQDWQKNNAGSGKIAWVAENILVASELAKSNIKVSFHNAKNHCLRCQHDMVIEYFHHSFDVSVW